MSCFSCCFKKPASSAQANTRQSHVFATAPSYQLDLQVTDQTPTITQISTSIALPVSTPITPPAVASSSHLPPTSNESQVDLGVPMTTPQTIQKPNSVNVSLSASTAPETQNDQLEQLRRAVLSRDIDTVVRLRDIWSLPLTSDGSTAAHLAVSENAVVVLQEMVDLVLNSPSDLFNIHNRFGQCPIHLCLSKPTPDSLVIFQHLLRLDLSVIGRQVTQSGDSLLTLAMNQPNEQILKLLLQAIPDHATMVFLITQHLDKNNCSALETALESLDCIPTFCHLIIALANVLDLVDTDNWTFRCIRQENVSAFRKLLEIDCFRVVNSHDGLLKDMLQIQSDCVLEFVDVVRDAVIARQILVLEQLVLILPMLITMGNPAILKAFLMFPQVDHVCEISDLTEDGPLLHHAVTLNQPDMVQMLLPLSRNVPNSEGCYPIHLAVLSDNPELVDTLLSHFQNPDVPGPKGQTSMVHYHAFMYILVRLTNRFLQHLATQHAHPTIISRLTAHGASPSIADSDGRYPLHYASEAKHVESVHALIVAGARGDTVTHEGVTPLLMALQSYTATTSLQLIAQLLNAPGTDLFMHDLNDKDTALHIAAAKGNVAVVRFMYEAASPTSPGSASFPQKQGLGRLRSPWEVHNASGWTPGHVAVSSGHPPDLVYNLLSLCDVDVLNTLSSSGQTLLDLLIEQDVSTSDSLIKSVRNLGARKAKELTTNLLLSTQRKSDCEDTLPFHLDNQTAIALPALQVLEHDPIVAYLKSNKACNDVASPSRWDDEFATDQIPEPVPVHQVLEYDPIAVYLNSNNASNNATSTASPQNKNPVETLVEDSAKHVTDDPISTYLKAASVLCSTSETETRVLRENPTNRKGTRNDPSHNSPSSAQYEGENVGLVENDNPPRRRFEGKQNSDDNFQSARELFIEDATVLQKREHVTKSQVNTSTALSLNTPNPSTNDALTCNQPPDGIAWVSEKKVKLRECLITDSGIDQAVPHNQGGGITGEDELIVCDCNTSNAQTDQEADTHANPSQVPDNVHSLKDIVKGSPRPPSSRSASINMDDSDFRDLVEEFELNELINGSKNDKSHRPSVQRSFGEEAVPPTVGSDTKSSDFEFYDTDPGTDISLTKSQMELKEKIKVLSNEEHQLIEETRQLNRTKSLSIDLNNDITGLSNGLVIKLPSSTNLSFVSTFSTSADLFTDSVRLRTRLNQEEMDIAIQMEKEFPAKSAHYRNLTSDTGASVDISEVERTSKMGQAL